MVLAVATNDTSHTFDLQAPAPPEYADYLPEDQTDRNEAAAINWIVLGRQQRFALVLDRSGSMTGDKLDKSKEGAYFWADAATTGDHIGVVSYADDVTVCPPTALGPPFMYVISDDTDGDAVQAAIDPISARGLTAIGDALRAGLEQIQADTLVGPVKGQDVIALVTDGYHNTGEDPSDVLDELIDYGVQVYTVGIGSSIHEPLLHDIASRTGGKFYRIDLGATENGAADQIKNSLIEIEEIAHGGGLVSYTSGSTNPGPVPESAYIEPGSKMATFTLSWDNPEHGFSLKLVAPNDEEITKDSLPANVRLVYSERTYMGFQVSNPGAFSSGDSDARWKLYVIPEHGTGRANYHLFVFSRNPHIHGGIASPSRLCQPGMSTPVHFHCCYDYPLTGLNVTGEVLLPNGKSRTLKFKDDGDMESGDVLGGDGLYSAILHETGKPGLYTIKVTVDSDGKSVRYGSRTGQPSDEEEDGSPPIPRFYRQFTRTVGVGEVPFKDVKPEPNSGYPGETLQVTLKGESTHFRQGDTTAGFGEGIQVGEIEVVDKHTARVAIAIAKDARLGLRDVTVATARYRETIEVEGGFQVVPHRCGCSVILARLWKLLRAIWQGLAFIDDVELTEERRDRNPRA